MDVRSKRPGQRSSSPARPGGRLRKASTLPDGQPLKPLDAPNPQSASRVESSPREDKPGAKGRSFQLPRPTTVLHKPSRSELWPKGSWRCLWLGFQSWLVPWAVLVLLAIGVWIPVSTTPAEQGTKWTDAMFTANAIFAAALNAEINTETLRFSLLPWGLTFMIGGLLVASLKAVKPASWWPLLWGIMAFLVPTWISLGVAAQVMKVWPAFIFSVFFALVVFFAVARRQPWWDLKVFFPEGEPWPWLTLATRFLRAVTITAAALTGVFLCLAIITGWGQMTEIWMGLKPDLIGSLAMVLGILAYLPNILVWTASWITGPGISLGTGTVFSPGQVIGGDLPPVPILAWPPDAPTGWWPLIFPIFSMIILGIFLGRRHQLNFSDTALSVALFLAALLLGGLAILWFTSGSFGPGRLVNTGPVSSTLYAGVLAWGIPFSISVLLSHQRTQDSARRFAARISGKDAQALPTARIEL